MHRKGGTTDPAGCRPKLNTARTAHGRQLHVEVAHSQRIVFDEVAAWLDHIAHQRREDLIRRNSILDPHLEQTPGFRVDSGVPELLWIHLAQTLEPLDCAAFL